jgi:mRNA interferase YafQ
MKKRHKNENDLFKIVDLLLNDQALPVKHKDHPLFGEWLDRRDCHIKPDWLLIYCKRGNDLILERTGSHSDLFK